MRRPSERVACLAVLVAALLVAGAQSSTPDKRDEPAPAKPVEGEPAAAVAAKSVAAAASEKTPASAAEDAATRKARADQVTAPDATKSAGAEQPKAAAAADAKTDKAAKATPSEPKAAPAKSAARQQPAASSSPKGSAAKSKLPANLGTVTSTGSGGPAHYMSKHDAYSAIAEKHGALAQDAVRKADKRNLQRFSGIQKASGGIGDMLSPFKGVSDSGLARTLGASMRSIIKGKYSVPAYVASALLGAVALMAFYESPISPLPVPPLPESPVGRFPPEMPNISPNLQVPFRMNNQQQQQHYNQRAFSDQLGSYAQQLSASQSQQQPQSVLFPGNTAQLRSASVGGGVGPVQQLAASLLGGGGGAKPQSAQRKSGADYDTPTSRSLFGPATGSSAHKASVPVNQQQKQNSLLSFFGLGASSASPAPAGSQTTQAGGQAAQPSGGAAAAAAVSSLLEPKGANSAAAAAAVASALSGSHLVNKVKSYFRPVSAAGAANPYEQYSRMSFAQALLKDSAYLPSLLAPTRKSSSGSSHANAATPSKLQQSLSQVLASATGGAALGAAGQQQAAARMQVDQIAAYNAQQQPAPAAAAKRVAASGNGLVRAADRIAHALLDTFLQRQPAATQTAEGGAIAARKSSAADEQSALISATSLLSDIMSGYGATSVGEQATAPGKQPEQGGSGVPAPQQQAAPHSHAEPNSEPQQKAGQQHSAQAAAAAAQPQQQQAQQQQAAAAQDASQQHVRKTRSIGFEYPTALTNELALAQSQPQPSKAAQINNLVDFVSDSYNQNKLLFNFVMNQVGLSQALPYVEQFLGPAGQAGNSQGQLYH